MTDLHTMKIKKTECACGMCQRACQKTPGWFRPGEMERAAKLLKVTPKAFFRKYCGVNWWDNDDGSDVFVLAPAVTSMRPGTEYPSSPSGTCVFFKDGRCAIHAAKPYECAHGNPHDSVYPAFLVAMKRERKRTRDLWKKQQRQIVTLLGRKPKSQPFSFLDHLFSALM